MFIWLITFNEYKTKKQQTSCGKGGGEGSVKIISREHKKTV